MKSLLKIIKKDIRFVFVIVAAGIVNSFLYSSLLIIINNRIQGRPPFFGTLQDEWMLFFAVMGVSLICRKWFQYQMIRFTNMMLFDFELDLVKNIKNAEYGNFSAIEHARVYTAMADIKVIAQVPRYFVDMVNHLVLITVCFVYLCLLSPLAAGIILAGSVLLGYYYAVRNRFVIGLLSRTRELETVFYEYISDLLGGFKYLKLSTSKEYSLFGKHITGNRNDAREAEIKAAVVYTNNELIGSFGWLVMLALPVFVIPLFSNAVSTVSAGITIVILYLMGPVNALILAIPFFSRIKVSLGRIEQFTKDVNPDAAAGAVRSSVMDLVPAGFSSITFSEVCFRHTNAVTGRQFTLGPISLSINRGELVFITGDNGSGKSTFLMLLSGLTSPAAGRISIDGVTITEHNAALLRNQIAAVYIDGYLFKKNYDNLPDNDAQCRRYLEMVKLDNLGLANIYDANASLSKGQQKRLALVQALLEEKEILILDEWASEQDPAFRNYFYTQLLPELQAMGKTIIAVTHDDRYFHCGDRAFHLRAGRLSDTPELTVSY